MVAPTNREVRVNVRVQTDISAARRDMDGLATSARQASLAVQDAHRQMEKVAKGSGKATYHAWMPDAESGRAWRAAAAGSLVSSGHSSGLGAPKGAASPAGAAKPGAGPAAAAGGSGMLGKLAGGAAIFGAAANAYGIAEVGRNPGSTARDVYDRAFDTIPFIGRPVGNMLMDTYEASRVGFAEFDRMQARIANAPMLRELRARDNDYLFEQRNRRDQLRHASATERVLRGYAGSRAEAVRSGGMAAMRFDDENPGLAAARDAREQADRDVRLAREADGIARRRAEEERAMANAGRGTASAANLRAEMLKGDAARDPGIGVRFSEAREKAISASESFLQQEKNTLEAINQAKEKSLALLDAEYQKNRAISGELKAQADSLKMKEDRLRGGIVGFAGMSETEREALRQSVQRVDQVGIGRADSADRQRVLGNALTSEFFGKQAVDAFQSDKTLNDILKATGQQGLQALVNERLKVTKEYKIKIEADEAQKASEERRLLEIVQKELDARGFKTKQIQDSQTRINQGAKNATG